MRLPENQQKGTDLEKVINSNNLCIPINLPASTQLSTSLYLDDPCGSDHLPIILEIIQPIHDENRSPC